MTYQLRNEITSYNGWFLEKDKALLQWKEIDNNKAHFELAQALSSN